MSGHKCSSINFIREREQIRKQQLLREINGILSRITSLSHKIEIELGGKSDGLLSTFKQEVNDANMFMKKEQRINQRQTNMTESSLVNKMSELSKILHEGEQVQINLTRAFNVKALTIRDRIKTKISAVKQQLSEKSELLEKLSQGKQIQQLRDELADVSVKYKKESYLHLEDKLRDIEKNISVHIDRANKQKKKQRDKEIKKKQEEEKRRQEEEKRRLRRAELGEEVALVESNYVKETELLDMWVSSNQVNEWQDKFDKVRSWINDDQFSEVESAINELDVQITKKIKWANGLEEKHQNRQYLLKALRQVCSDMGFEEVRKPSREEKEDRGSRIRFTVDTLDRGAIEFILSLDGLSCHSEIDDDHCFGELDHISEYLDSEFGINTKFRLAEDEPTPELRQKGEKDLPSDSGITREAEV